MPCSQSHCLILLARQIGYEGLGWRPRISGAPKQNGHHGTGRQSGNGSYNR